MENLHLKPSEDRIEAGVAGLKAAAMPDAPSRLVEQLLSNPAPSRRTSAAWVWRSLAACGVVGVVALVAVPRPSSAAVSISRLVTAYQGSQVMFRLTPYWVVDGELRPKIWHGYVLGNQWRYVQADFEQASDGVGVMSYFPGRGEAQVWRQVSGDQELRSVLADADLSWWKSNERKGLILQHNVLWKGQQVDRYEITTYSKSWGATRNILYADPIRNRPIFSESLHASGNGSAQKWDYITPPQPELLRISLKPETKVVDVTAEREAQRRKNLGKPLLPQKASDGSA